jgi:hypothetical protein
MTGIFSATCMAKSRHSSVFLAGVLVAALTAGCGSDEDLAEITLTAEHGSEHARVWIPVNEPRSIGTYVAEIDWGDGTTDVVRSERDGMLVGVWLADLAGGADPELVVATASSGSGSYGAAHVYARADGEPVSVDLAGLNEEQRKGYMGHDVFSVEDGVLTREFPVYLSDDSNAEPSGGTVRLSYDFRHNEWLSETSP